MGCRNIIRKVAIIGGGPKGIYGFERLTAWLKINPPSDRTEIHVFNKTDSFGAGENFRIEQYPYLLMNNPVCEINMWDEKEPLPVVPHPLSFSEWLHQIAGIKIPPNDYASRAMAGRYLSYGFHLITSNLPKNVIGKYRIGEVVDVFKDSEKYMICLKTDDTVNCCPGDRFDHVLLATGHPSFTETEQSLNIRSFTETHKKAGYLPFVYPTESVFKNVPRNCRVGIKGMGLTFVDAVLALTEGKGGRFEREQKKFTLAYRPSGEEPAVIYPFSRSGLPMIPRRSIPNENNRLCFFSRTALERMNSGGKLNFEQQIWPLLRQEMIYTYYDVAKRNSGYPGGLSACKDFDEVERCIIKYHKKYPSEIRFDVDHFLDPLQKPEYHDEVSHHHIIKTLSREYLMEACKGELRSPLAAVAAVWRNVSSLFCEVYSFGGLTPESQRFFDSTIRGKMNRISYGSPVQSAEKIVSLMECGILNFNAARNPGLILDEKSGMFILESGKNNIRYPFQYLVDARIAKMSLSDQPGLLFRNLLNRGLITIHENGFGKDVYQTGAVNITRQGFVIDKYGSVNRGIAVTGTPTEGITFDNDTLSRDRNNFVDNWAEIISKEYTK